MRKNSKLARYIFCAMIIAIAIFSAISLSVSHNCVGYFCPVCQFIRFGRELAYAMSVFCAAELCIELACARISPFFSEIFSVLATPVQQKVKIIS